MTAQTAAQSAAQSSAGPDDRINEHLAQELRLVNENIRRVFRSSMLRFAQERGLSAEEAYEELVDDEGTAEIAALLACDPDTLLRGFGSLEPLLSHPGYDSAHQPTWAKEIFSTMETLIATVFGGDVLDADRRGRASPTVAPREGGPRAAVFADQATAKQMRYQLDHARGTRGRVGAAPGIAAAASVVPHAGKVSRASAPKKTVRTSM